MSDLLIGGGPGCTWCGLTYGEHMTGCPNTKPSDSVERDFLTKELTPQELLAELDHVTKCHHSIYKSTYTKELLIQAFQALTRMKNDGERLDFLDRNLSNKFGWKVNVAPSGTIIVTSVVHIGSHTEPMPIRAAIDGALRTTT